MLQEYVETCKKITHSIYQICIYGNGITREEAFQMTYKERKIFLSILEEKAKAMSGKETL